MFANTDGSAIYIYLKNLADTFLVHLVLSSVITHCLKYLQELCFILWRASTACE